MKKLIALGVLIVLGVFLILFNNKKYIIFADSNSWDEYIREIGNVIYNQNTKEYLLYYSGHLGKNVRGKNDVYVGLATSTDYINWKKEGKVFDELGEDPYVIFCQGAYWMFYEEKSRIPDVTTSLARSVDGKHFELFKRDIIVPRENSFESRDTSSPVAVCLPDKVVVLYEARSTEKVGAALGYAESKDFINWKQSDTPVHNLGKNRFIVPDDIRYEAGRYLLTYHDVDELMSVGRTDWKTDILASPELISWEHIDSLNRSDYLMYFSGTFIGSNKTGIFTTKR